MQFTIPTRAMPVEPECNDLHSSVQLVQSPDSEGVTVTRRRVLVTVGTGCVACAWACSSQGPQVRLNESILETRTRAASCGAPPDAAGRRGGAPPCLWVHYAALRKRRTSPVADSRRRANAMTPTEQRARASALYQMVVSISLALGAAVGGLIVTAWGFAAIFLISALIRWVAAILFARYVK